jgi:hypothetical protein
LLEIEKENKDDKDERKKRKEWKKKRTGQKNLWKDIKHNTGKQIEIIIGKKRD